MGYGKKNNPIIQIEDPQFKQEVTAQLAQNTQRIDSLGSGSPGVYPTLTDLQTAFPSGDSKTYVVTADGNWYYWNSSAWTLGGIYHSFETEAMTVQDEPWEVI